jgi:hypothetical protein
MEECQRDKLGNIAGVDASAKTNRKTTLSINNLKARRAAKLVIKLSVLALANVFLSALRSTNFSRT